VLLVFAIYAFSSEGPVYQYAMQVIVLVLISYLLWRVETLSDLSISVNDVKDLNTPDKQERGISPGEKYSLSQNIGPLLKQYCEEPQLYLQHDLTLLQLAKAVGTNRLYLSQYFSAQGITYNAYINDLRINHFVSLFHESVGNHRSFTAQQLAHESGFHNYNTFSSAFKRKMGQPVTTWMKAHKGLG
jgi:AraC-like DNA-binding protein